MPWYRIPGKDGPITVHMHGRNLPKPCATRGCGDISAYLCDGPNRGDPRDGKTCDAPICKLHAREVGRNRHHCPDCQAAAPQRELAL